MKFSLLSVNFYLSFFTLSITTWILANSLEHGDKNSSLFLFILSLIPIIILTILNWLTLKFLTAIFRKHKVSFLVFLIIPFLFLGFTLLTNTLDKIAATILICLTVINLLTFAFSKNTRVT